jgi:hypothetical protein
MTRLPFCREARVVGSAFGLLVAFAVCIAPAASAQGSLSTLGFGYPVGGNSTRVSGTAGAFSEFDAVTQANPSALGGVTRTVVSVQAEPEYRTLKLGTVTEKTSSQRIPLLSVIFPARPNLAVGLSASSYLDRSYTLRTTGTVNIGSGTLTTNDLLSVRGAIGMLRASVGWQATSRFKVGLAGSLFTGDNLVARERIFSDTTAFGSLVDTSQVTYFGTAVTLGGEARLTKALAATLSYRAGGGFDARVRDTVRASADVPHLLGASVRYEGIPGSVFAVGIEQIAWSRMRTLGTGLVNAQDAFNWRLGVETAGPRWRGLPLLVRLGFAQNQLPFSTTSTRITESRWSGGLGIPIAREFGEIDFSIQRANRALAGSGATENAWLFGAGLQIRP